MIKKLQEKNNSSDWFLILLTYCYFLIRTNSCMLFTSHVRLRKRIWWWWWCFHAFITTFYCTIIQLLWPSEACHAAMAAHMTTVWQPNLTLGAFERGSWRQFSLHPCRTLDLVTMRAYVTYLLTVHKCLFTHLLTCAVATTMQSHFT